MQRGILSRNATLVGTAFARMWSSIAISPQHGDGLMADGSFHQHGPLLQSGSYGGALMTDVLAFSTLAAGTSFAIPPAPLAVLAAYLVNGQQYMLRGAGETAVWLTLRVAARLSASQTRERFRGPKLQPGLPLSSRIQGSQWPPSWRSSGRD